jgi:hypothetical protein
MPDGMVSRTLERAGALRRLPVARLVALGELVMLLREHTQKLAPHERRRLIELVRRGRGRPSSLSARERRELFSLLAKTEPRVFLNHAVQKLTGVPVKGRRRGRR